MAAPGRKASAIHGSVTVIVFGMAGISGVFDHCTIAGHRPAPLLPLPVIEWRKMLLRNPILALVSMLPFFAAAQQAGVPTEWDVQKLVATIAAQSARLQQMVDQIQPKDWVARGASDTYLQQWGSAHSQAASVKLSSDNLVQDPARLSAALDTYFRL